MEGMMNNEPVFTAGAAAGLILAVVSFARTMGWMPLTEDQLNAMMTVIGLALPVIFAVWAREYVTPVANPRIEDEHGVLVPLVPKQ
jgi:hypothetical protein